MKSLTIAAVLLFLSFTVNAQIQLEASYSFSGTLTEIDEGEYKYFVMDVPLNQCRIYNEDHTLFKTIDLSVPDGYYLSDIKYLSRRTFNTDDDIELLYTYSKAEVIDSDRVVSYGLRVVSENGSVLLKLNDGGYAEIKEGTDGPRLLAYQYIWNESYYLVNTLIYTLASSTKAQSYESVHGISMFPNPAKDQLYIHIESQTEWPAGKVIVSDISGRRVSTQDFPQGKQNVNVNTQNLPAGTYIVNVATDEGILASEKIVKK